MGWRVALFFACLLLAAPSLAAQAFPNREFDWQGQGPIRTSYEAPWVADMRPAPRFPITVQLQLRSYRDTGISYVGDGKAHVFNPKGEDLNFKSRCGIPFEASRATEFYARWIQPDRKLEIILRKPGTERTHTCRVSVSPPTS